MPQLRPSSPDALKQVLIAAGYELIDESEYNWVFAIGTRGAPIILPKKGDALTPPVLAHIWEKTKGTSAESVFQDTLIGTEYDDTDQDDQGVP